MKLKYLIPVVGQVWALVDQVRTIAANKKALKAAIANADARRKTANELGKRLDRIVTDAKKLK